MWGVAMPGFESVSWMGVWGRSMSALVSEEMNALVVFTLSASISFPSVEFFDGTFSYLLLEALNPSFGFQSQAAALTCNAKREGDFSYVADMFLLLYSAKPVLVNGDHYLLSPYAITFEATFMAGSMHPACPKPASLTTLQKYRHAHPRLPIPQRWHLRQIHPPRLAKYLYLPGRIIPLLPHQSSPRLLWLCVPNTLPRHDDSFLLRY